MADQSGAPERGTGDGVPPDPGAGSEPEHPGPPSRSPASSGGRFSSRRGLWVGVVSGAAAVAVVGVSVGLWATRASGLPLGAGTATISWTASGPAGAAGGSAQAPDSVSGSAAGWAVTAAASHPTFVAKPGEFAHYPIADVAGSIDGHHFTVDISLSLGRYEGKAAGLVNFGRVTGTFEGRAIRADLTASTTAPLIDFDGTIGPYKVTGTMKQPTTHGGTSVAHASFTVTD